MQCWEKRTVLEKKTLLILVVLLFLLTILITLIMVFSEPSYCQTASCIKSSKHILQMLDSSQSPCSDFYKFSCGGFAKQPRSFNSVIDEEKAKNELKLKELVLKAQETDSKSLKLQKLFYHSCLDLQAIDANRDGPWLDLLKKLGGWPVVLGNNWDESAFDLVEMMVNLRELGLPHGWFFNVSVSSNFTENSWIEIKVPDSYENILENQQQLYTELMKDVAVHYGAHEYVARTEMKDVMFFELKLLKLFNEMKHEPKAILSVEEVQTQWQKINWFELLKQITRSQLSEQSQIEFYVSNYLPKLDKLLRETRKRTQVNYVIWKLIVNYAQFLSIRNKIANYRHQLLNQTDLWHTNREQYCYEKTRSSFCFALEATYLRYYVPQSKRIKIEQMLEMIRDEMDQRLFQAKWMDAPTKKTAMTKLKNVSFIIGGPEEMYYIEQFDKYVGTGLVPDNSTRNIIDFARAIAAKNFDLMFDPAQRKNYRKHELYELAPTLKAHFIREYNLLYIPAGLLQDFFYDESRPNYLNYATLGAIIGHELTHGFDSGVFGKTNWWSNATRRNFKTISGCLQNHEQIGYLSGINLAYEAYQKWSRLNPAELNLPGLVFLPNQIYWLAHSSLTCHRDGLSEEHFLHSHQMLESYKNSIYFSKDFECSVNTKMNPQIKCQIL